MDLWIRVDASSCRDPRIAAFGKFLGISTATALGFLVMVWSAMAEHAPDGVLGEAADCLEEWANWRGEPGKFARAFQDLFVDGGEVRGYRERQGKLVEIRAKERARKRRGSSAEIPSLRDETRRNEVLTPCSPPAGDAPAPPPAPVVVRSNGNGSHPGRALARIKPEVMPALEVVLAKTEQRSRRQEYRQALAGAVFAYWASRMGHPASRLDPKRRRRIEARLEESGDNVRELLYAVDGTLRDDWLMGKDPRSTKRYDGIETVFRDRAQVERLAEMAPGFARGDPHPMEAQIPPLSVGVA